MPSPFSFVTTDSTQVPVFHVANSIIRACHPTPISAEHLHSALYLLAEHLYVTKREYPYHMLFTAASPGPIVQEISTFLLTRPRKRLQPLSLAGPALYTDLFAREITQVALICTFVPLHTIREAILAPGRAWDIARQQDTGNIELSILDEIKTSTLSTLLPLAIERRFARIEKSR